jgi:hypothetical protein
MHEILTDPEILAARVLDLDELQLAGVPFGAEAATIPGTRVTQVTLAPIVANSTSGTNIPSEYFDAGGRQLPIEEVIDSVVADGGILHFEEGVSFKIAGGRVVGFALYGNSLRHFAYLKRYEDFCSAFGHADHVVAEEAYNDLMGYTHYFFGSRKCVRWNASDNRISLINLGAFDGNDP